MRRLVAMASVIVAGLCFAEVGSGTSPEGPLDIRKREEAPPSLSFTASLTDANGNGICEGEELILLPVTVRNSGKGAASGVRIVLSGSSGLVSRLGAENLVGSIEPGASVTETLRTVLPPKVAAEEGKTLTVRVDAGEWSPTDENTFEVAIQPKKGTRGTEKTYVDVDIVPQSRGEDPDAVAAVIGISQYREAGVPDVAFGQRDAETMRDYLVNVCGVKPANVFTLYGDRATKSDLDDLFGTRLPRKVKPNGTVYIYFAGHGTPGKDKQPLLVPWDATADAEAKLYPVERIVEQANAWKAKRTLVMLDVCFAGTNRALAPEGRPLVAVDMSQLTAGDKCVVLTASGASQTANDLKDAKHGLFTYYLLKALKGDGDTDADGWISTKELYDYVRENVSREAADKLQAEQEPTMLPEGVEQSSGRWKVARSR